ncbi:MAG TPA: branched-chain amino acid ABC transporter permease [Solirubrobacterales bacterium]
MSSDELTVILVGGLVTGAVYGMAALALVLVYKGSRVINLAQGDFGMFGVFVFYAVAISSGLGKVPGIAAALITAALLAALVERLVISRLRDAPGGVAMVATLGVATLLQVAATDIWSAEARYLPPLIEGNAFNIGLVVVSNSQLLALGTGAVVAVAVGLMYRFTPFGLKVRAVAQNPYGASLLGVDERWVSIGLWAVGGLIAGLAGLVIAPLVTFQVAFMLLLLARVLTAAVVGGLTSLVGAFLAALVLGVVEQAIAIKTSEPGLLELVLFLLVLVVLTLRPQGLGRTEY